VTDLTTAAEFEALVERHDLFLFDCDGVIWHGNEPIGKAVQLIAMLQARGKTCVFVTNNATKSRETYVAKFAKMGVTVQESHIYSGAYAAARYLSAIGFKRRVYCAGEPGLAHELKQAGLLMAEQSHLDRLPATPSEAFDPSLIAPDDVGAVVIGFNQFFNYRLLSFAHHVLFRKPDNVFIATNLDPQMPHGPDQLWPGGGALVAALRCSTEREPHVTGKPSKLMFDLIKQEFHVDPARTVMFGDRLTTDVLFGLNSGTTTVLVLSGVETRETLAQSSIRPHFIMNSAGEFCE
jgi:phosphoglycolate/pyridoxal phosphate phosphatase family enzyme